MTRTDVLGSGLLAVIVLYAAVFLHEVTHVTVSFLATGKLGTCPGTGLPIGADLVGVIPRFYACVYPALPGWNPLITNAVTAFFGIGILWYGSTYNTPIARWGTLIGGTVTWIRFGLYMMGVLYIPVYVNGGVSYSLAGDGFSILQTFGPLGMLPGAVVLAVGSIVTWRRIRGSREACACGRELGSASNIEYREFVK